MAESRTFCRVPTSARGRGTRCAHRLNGLGTCRDAAYPGRGPVESILVGGACGDA